jgi:hypothetical protein
MGWNWERRVRRHNKKRPKRTCCRAQPTARGGTTTHLYHVQLAVVCDSVVLLKDVALGGGQGGQGRQQHGGQGHKSGRSMDGHGGKSRGRRKSALHIHGSGKAWVVGDLVVQARQPGQKSSPAQGLSSSNETREPFQDSWQGGVATGVQRGRAAGRKSLRKCLPSAPSP